MISARVRRVMQIWRAAQLGCRSVARSRFALLIFSLGLAACGGQVLSAPTPTPYSLAIQLPSPTPLSSTVSPRIRTPAPTFTPAPTPTPVIHIVEPGETLLGIALQYNISLDALQQVNGVLRPETLQIGQKLIIPIGGTSPDAGGGIVLPTPTPVAIQVQHTALHQTPVGSIWVLGEVFNPGDTALENVQVQVSLLDVSGEAVITSSTFVAVEAVPAGGRSPFGVLFENPPPEAVAFEAIAIRAELSRNSDTRYVQLKVADIQARPDGTTYQLTGTVLNDSSTDATATTAIVTVYDAQQHVIGFRQAPIGDGQIAAGATAPLDMTVAPDSGGVVADYSIVVQGRVGR